MTDPTPAPDAVQVIADALHGLIANDRGRAETVVAALSAAGLLVDRERLAALEAVATAAREYIQWGGDVDWHRLSAALDAVPPLPAEMAERARRHPDGEGLPGTGVADDPEALAGVMDEVPDLLAHLDDERQDAHDRARRDDPGHDQVGCVCCCCDCDK